MKYWRNVVKKYIILTTLNEVRIIAATMHSGRTGDSSYSSCNASSHLLLQQLQSIQWFTVILVHYHQPIDLKLVYFAEHVHCNQFTVAIFSYNALPRETSIRGFSERYAIARPSVCRLSSVTLVRPSQAVEIFGNISTAFVTLVTRWYPANILRRSSQRNPSVGGVKHNRGSHI